MREGNMCARAAGGEGDIYSPCGSNFLGVGRNNSMCIPPNPRRVSI